MEPSTNNAKCSFCQKELSTSHISYTCAHSFCLECYPYLFLDLLRSKGIDVNFFEHPETEHPCLICYTGTVKFPYEQLFKDFNQEKPSLKVSKDPVVKLKIICYACDENPAKNFCVECS